MKTQFTSLFFCALLFSTLGHEYRNAHHIGQEARLSKHPQDSANLLSHFQFRDNDNSAQCQWECPCGPLIPDTGLTLVVNENVSIVAIVNASASVAIAFDISANLVALFNGTSGAAIVVNLQSQEGIYIAAGASTEVWISSNQTFEVFFQHLTSLRVVYEIGLKVGISFNSRTVTLIVLQQISSMLILLSAQYAVVFQASISLALSVLINISKEIIGHFRGVVRILLIGVGFTIVHLRGDIIWFSYVLKGLVKLFSAIHGGIAVITAKSIRFNLQLIFGAAVGIEMLLNILTELSVYFDLSVILRTVLNSPVLFFEIIVLLGGNLSHGINGLFNVVYHIMLLIKAKVSIEIFLQILLNFSVGGLNEVQESEIIVIIRSLLKVIDEQEQTHHNSARLEAFIKLLKNILAGDWIIDGVNISAIIKILYRVGSLAAIDLVINILLLLNVVIKNAVAIPRLILYMFTSLNSTIGIQLVMKVIPGLKIDQSIVVGGSGNIIVQILKGINIPQIISGGFDVVTIISRLPVFGAIYSAISVSVTAVSNGSINCNALMKSSGAHSVLIKIQAWLSGILRINIEGGISIRDQHLKQNQEHRSHHHESEMKYRKIHTHNNEIHHEHQHS